MAASKKKEQLLAKVKRHRAESQPGVHQVQLDLDELAPLLCPFHPGQVIRWGGLSSRGCPAIVETVGAKPGTKRGVYWLVQAVKLDKQLERTNVRLRGHELTWQAHYSDEPVDNRTINEVKRVVNKKIEEDLQRVLQTPPADKGDGDESEQEQPGGDQGST